MRCKLITIVLTLFLLITLTAIISEVAVRTASADSTSGDYQYVVINGGTAVEITGYSGSGGIVSIPDHMDGTPVTAIADNSFQGSAITDLIIPQGVTFIGNYAFFGCSGLTNVIIPNSVTTIGDVAFCNCPDLTNVTLPTGITSIGNNEFQGCSALTNVTILGSVTRIGDYAFTYCSVLTNFSIPNSVTFIGDSAFSGCSALTNITIPSGVTSIGISEFQECSALINVTIPSSVTIIEDYAFFRCSALTNITIPGSVTSIGNCVFARCSALTNITIPNGVTSIGISEFQGCSVLVNVTIPSSVTSIQDQAFQYCSDLTNITIPSGVTFIGNYSFQACPLTSVTIPAGVTKIQGYTFASCRFTSISIPSKVTSIGDYAFAWCGDLTSVTIPNGVTSIGSYAFIYCGSLTNVTIPGSVITIGDFAFDNCPLNSVTIPYGVASIGNNAFQMCSLTSVNISSSVTTIGSYAFSDCPLSSVTIPNNVTSIGDGCFAGCTALPSVIIPSKVTSIGNHEFEQCWDLTSVTIPNNVTSIGNYAFQYCYDLTSIVIPGNVTSIGDYAFAWCSDLTSVTIPGSVTALGDGAFGYCSALTSVTISKNVTSMGNYAFEYCSDLTSVTIPSKVTSIGNYAFEYCSALTNVTIPSSVTSIGDWAFNDCTHLTSVTIPASVTHVGFALAYCTHLSAITFAGNAPASVGSSFGYGGASNETVYYHIGATGFTTPTWKGLHCVPLATMPSAPTGLIATAGNGQVALNWTAPANNGGASIDHYVVFENGAAAGTFTTLTATITGLTNGQTYIFKVAAHNSVGNGPNSTAVNGMPLSPITVTITSPTNNFLNNTDTVTVSWSGSGSIAYYDVSLDGGNYLNVSSALSHTFGSLSDNQHNVMVKAFDGEGNSVIAEVNFTVDTIAPTIIITAPTVGYLSNNGIVGVNLFPSDSGSGLAKTEIKVDSGPWTTISWTSNTLTSLADGPHILYVRATDNAGNVNTSSVAFTVDTIAPSVSITSPATGSYNNTGSVTINWIASDSGSGIAKTEIQVDSGSWNTVSGTSDALTSLANGAHIVTVKVTDNAGNTNTTSVIFAVDTVAPSVSITSPTNGSYNNTGSVTVSWTATDSGHGFTETKNNVDLTSVAAPSVPFHGSGIAKIEIKLDSGSWSTMTGTSDGLSGLSDGSHTVSVRATDYAGNMNTASVTFTVDTVAPGVSITIPTSGSYINSSSANVQWTASDSGSGIAMMEIKLDTGSWSTVAGTTDTLTSLADGPHTVAVRVTDNAGNVNSSSASFVVDTVAPDLSITTPTSGSYNDTGIVAVKWTASDLGSGMVKTEIKLDAGSWSTVTGTNDTLTSLADGSHTVEVRATDNAGNTNTTSVTFIVDTIAPVITMTSPSSGSYNNTGSVTVSGTATDSGSGIAKAEIKVDSYPWNLVTEVSAVLSGLSDGSHTITVRATDDAGNVNTTSVTFTVDKVAPTLFIIAPGIASYNNTGSVTVSWAASDPGSGMAKTEIELGSGSWSTVSGTSDRLSGLSDGSHTVTVRATDNAGNVKTASVTFIVDTVAPSVSITSPTSGSYNNTGRVTVSWTATDSGHGFTETENNVDLTSVAAPSTPRSYGIAKTEIKVDSGPWSTVSGSSDILTSLADGPHTVSVRATDYAGNMNTASVTFTVDKVAPTVSILAPGSGSYNNTGSVTVKWTASDTGSGLAKTEISNDGTTWNVVSGTTDRLTGFSDALHTIYIRATDNAGNVNTASVTFTVDTVKPVLNIVAPGQGSWYNTTTLNVTWTASDPGSGIAYFLVSHDNAQWINGTNDYQMLGGLTNGQHTVEVRAYDKAGNYNDSALQFNVDANKPTLAIVTPIENALLNSTTVEVSWNASGASGIAGYRVSIDGGVWTGVAKDNTHSFTSLADGNHVVIVKAENNVGDWNETSVSFVIDTVAPTISTHSSNGSNMSCDATISATFTETMNTSSVRVVVNGVSGTLTWNGNNVSFAPTARLAYDTIYSVDVSGKDLAGNVVEYTWSFTTMKNEGTIEGLIKDAGGNPIANATVTLSNGMSTATDASGHFLFGNVPSGNYTLNATKAGLEPITQSVSASAGQTNELAALSALASPSSTSDNIYLIGAGAITAVALLIFLLIVRHRKKKE